MIELRPHVESFLGELFSHQPVFATQMGDHRFDDSWPDYSDQGLAPFTAVLARWGRFFGGLEGQLARDDAIDRELLVDEIQRMLFEVNELAEHRWDPLGYVYLAGGGLFALLAREFAPLPERMNSFAGRVEGLPQLFATAQANLTGLPDRPVSLLHLETALGQLDGIGQLVDEARATARLALEQAPDAALVDALARVDAAAPVARVALEEFRTRLDGEIRSRAEGEGRLGPELFAKKLRWTLGSDLTPPELLERAERDRARITAEMLRLAHEVWPRWLPDRPVPSPDEAGSRDAADRETIRLALDAIAGEHPAATDLLDRFRTEESGLESFVSERGLLKIPDEPLEIIWTPLFLRSFGGAYLDPPGPLERGQKSFFGVTPPPDDATPEQVESMVREMNDRMLKVTCIHETVPGHYLQLWYSNRYGTLARAVFFSDVFAEGWAVYVTQVMIDLGYGGDDPALLLTHWKFYLRGIINAILDVRIHTGIGGAVDQAEALRLMVEQGFQEEAEARAKWNRARLSSTQLSTYFVGSSEMWDFELESRRRAARAAGWERPLPEPRVVGGLGDTPGFSYPAHLESVLSHGTPPMRLLRRILFDAPTVAG